MKYFLFIIFFPFNLKITIKFLKEGIEKADPEKLIPHEDLLNPKPGKSTTRDRELILEIYFIVKRLSFNSKLSKKQKQRNGTRSQQLAKVNY